MSATYTVIETRFGLRAQPILAGANEAPEAQNVRRQRARHLIRQAGLPALSRCPLVGSGPDRAPGLTQDEAIRLASRIETQRRAGTRVGAPA